MFNTSNLIEDIKNGTVTPLSYSFNKVTEQYSQYVDLLNRGDYTNFLFKMDELNLDTFPGNYLDRLNLLISLIIAFRDSPENPLKEKSINVVINKWKSPQDDDPSGVIGDLINSYSCPVDAIENILNYYDDISASEIIESQIKNLNGFSLNLLLDRINALFKNRTSNRVPIGENEWKYLRAIASQYENTSVLDWINSRLKNELSIAEKPFWVDLRNNETSEVLDFDLWKAIDEKSLGIPKVNPENFKNHLNEQFSFTHDGEIVDDSTINEIANTALNSAGFTSILNEMRNEDIKYPCDPDRMFGPINRREDSECVSGIKGGCRMLSCVCRTFDQSDDAEPGIPDPESWFEGVCDNCERKILDISYCLRYPIVGGSFVGCFCSSDCLKIKPSREPTSVTEMMIDNIFSVIEEKGIVDRSKLNEDVENNENEGDEEDEEIDNFYAKSFIKDMDNFDIEKLR